jgi:hypothetical protein
MIDNADQDEWFNLYLYLGSCWVNKSRYEARYSIRYRTRSPDLTKESRSIDRAETENHGAERSLDTKVELNPDVWGPGLLLSQFQDHLLKKDQFVDDLFNLHHLPDQPKPGSVIHCSLRRTDPDFQSIFSVR